MAYLFKHKKMLLLLFFTGLHLLLIAAKADSSLCVKMKWEKFNYLNDVSQTIIVERQRAIQIETNQANKEVTKF
jgi:hypothetical protein